MFCRQPPRVTLAQVVPDRKKLRHYFIPLLDYQLLLGTELEGTSLPDSWQG